MAEKIIMGAFVVFSLALIVLMLALLARGVCEVWELCQ